MTSRRGRGRARAWDTTALIPLAQKAVRPHSVRRRKAKKAKRCVNQVGEDDCDDVHEEVREEPKG